ncbi:hypothetical protein F7984_08390 [Pradoshia sp. D12]|uniref:hypothetical protein n=1 Tax=Bacillaceae TaxID=186817 RepID=UPI00112952FC|nr:MULTISPECIES: hypothetical protein [Bacillaceae]QFK71262.1 hypothetical protein F7984_08390 [Pradoshia sp. D12]TPF73055.1 hypothetical protein FHY44_04780 [Bacillus sp. D12]
MQYVRYSLLLLTCYLTVMFSGLIPVVFFDSFGMFLGSYISMSIGITILLFGLFFMKMKENHSLKMRLLVINTIGFLLFHFNFAVYTSYNSMVLCYPILAVLTLVAYDKYYKKQKEKGNRIYY